MAKLMDVTTAEGITVPQAYFYPETIVRQKRARVCRITFLGFKDKDARDDGKEPLSGAEKSYCVNGEDYDKYFSDDAFAKKKTTLGKQAYLYADATLDTEGQSFFATAEDA